MPDRSPAEVSAERVLAAGAEAERRVLARDAPMALRVARDWLVNPVSREVLREVCAALADRPGSNGNTANAWLLLTGALSDPDLEEDHGKR